MLLRRRVGLLGGRALITEAARIALAAVLAAVVALGVWWPLDSALGRSTAGQLGSLVPALAAAGARLPVPRACWGWRTSPCCGRCFGVYRGGMSA